MKPSILIATLLLSIFSLTAFAQNLKPDTGKKTPPATAKDAPAKPAYQADQSKVYHITLDLTGPEIFSISSGLDGTLHKSTQISAAQADDYDTDNKGFAKAIKAQAGLQAEADYKKWVADTTALYHPDALKPKGKPKSKK